MGRVSAHNAALVVCRRTILVATRSRPSPPLIQRPSRMRKSSPAEKRDGGPVQAVVLASQVAGLLEDLGNLFGFGMSGEIAPVPPHHLCLITLIRVGRRGNA